MLYILLAVVVIGLVFWFLKRKKNDSGPTGSQPTPPSYPPAGPTPPQM